MGKFIYVFNEEAKEILLKSGYKLLKSDELAGTFVFVSPDKDAMKFALENVSYISSDILSF